MANKAHIEIAIKITNVDKKHNMELSSDLVADFLMSELNCSGVVTEETMYKDEKIISEEKNTIKGYFWNNPENPLSEADILNKIQAKRNEYISIGIIPEALGEWVVAMSIVPEEQWAHSWKKYWHPQKIGTKVVICPSWEDYQPTEGEIVLSLDPGSAFGTGTHPTTRLCIEALEELVFEDAQIADIGMGSGILSVCAVKFGAKSVIGVDNDPSVINVANENAEKNNVKNSTKFYCGSAADVNGVYDIVVANILHNILIDIKNDLNKLLKQGSKLVLSGIIKEKEQVVLENFLALGLKHEKTLNEDNWVAIVLSK